MLVTAIHHIHDPAGFQKAGGELSEKGIPGEFKLPIHAATSDHSMGICIWEGGSRGDVARSGAAISSILPRKRQRRLTSSSKRVVRCRSPNTRNSSMETSG